MAKLYGFKCKRCDTRFDVYGEDWRGSTPPDCPACNDNILVKRDYSTFGVVTWVGGKPSSHDPQLY